MISHPDKGGSEELFKIVVNSFKVLSAEYNRRVADKQHHELKTSYDSYKGRHAVPPPQAPSSGGSGGNKNNKFDVDRFNRIFDDHRTTTAIDTGYKDWMEKGEDLEDSQKIKVSGKGDKFAANFNKAFEKHVRPVTQNKQIIEYKEPEALVVVSKKINFTELGVDKIDDFSGENNSRKHINYMDYKIAHTTNRIVDPTSVSERKSFKNIAELEMERGQVTYNMSDDDYKYYLEKKQKEEEDEKRRLRVLMQQDETAADTFDRIHRLMLAGAPSGRRA